ncbi:MAG TPA: hypothetical protein DDX71_06725 [Ruminococcus sp.]|nr:hypothetical protein [Ruminococcus sp.]
MGLSSFRSVLFADFIVAYDNAKVNAARRIVSKLSLHCNRMRQTPLPKNGNGVCENWENESDYCCNII